MNKPVSVVISGYYGFGNAGDEAMLSSIIEALTELEPKINITVLSGNPIDTRRRHGVKAVYRLNYPGILKALKKCNLLISGGGSLLQDVTSERSLYYYLSIMLLAKKLGKKVMLYGQGIGPVGSSVAQSAVRTVGNKLDLITVRDDGSKKELERLGIVKPRVVVTADPVLAAHPVDRHWGRNILRRHGLEGIAPLIGFSVREWKGWQRYKDIIAEAADRMVEDFGARIVFLPMQWPDDLSVAEKITAAMKHPALVLTEEYTTAELLSLTGNMSMLLGIRLHALIFAAVMQVPLMGISYDPKIDRFLETIGDSPAGTLETITADMILEQAWHLLQDGGNVVGKRSEQMGELRRKAFYNAELALELIESDK